MPLRFLLYIADLYSVLTKDENEYGTRQIPLPALRFLVFYNGREEAPGEQTLRLSASFLVPEEELALELIVQVLNINAGYNKGLLSACRELGDYAEFVGRIRKYERSLPLETAVEKAIEECIHEGILQEFLEKNRAEVKKVSIYEYDAGGIIGLNQEKPNKVEGLH